MQNPFYLWTIVMLFPCSTGYSQSINISWKRPVHYQDYFYENYDPGPFHVIDLYVEKPLKSEYFSVGAEVIYANYRPNLVGVYEEYFSKDDYYDRSIALGINARVYTLPFKIRGFVELGLQGNYLWMRQPIVIPHAFGAYTEVITHEQFAMSATLATGFSLGGPRVKWEPYIQYGMIDPMKEMWREQYMTGSVGRVRKNSNEGWIISPVVIKVLLGKIEE